MVGCCGQAQGRGADPRGAQGAYTQGGVQGGAYGQGGARCVSASHNEEVCHGTGERRRDLLDQVKIFLDEFDDRPCQSTPQGRGSAGATRPLAEYPEYLKKHCQSWSPAQPRPPLITSVQTHEYRKVQDYENARRGNTEYVTYLDGRIRPPPPSCDCAKRNGLQDECPRPECTPPTPQCLASNPGPCCPPSMGLTREEAAAGRGPQGMIQRQGGGNAQLDRQVQVSDRSAPGGGPVQQPQGIQMVCFCQEPPSSMPKGQKYLCCPAPMY